MLLIKLKKEGVMNKSAKGFLSAASILTIVSSVLAVLLAFLLFLAGSMCTESVIKDSYKDSGEYVYYEEADGSYYFVEIDEDTMTEELRIPESEIEMIAKISSAVLYITGVLNLIVPIAKLVLAIKILVNNNREKFGSASTIALLVLSIITINILESAFLIVALCLKNKNSTASNKSEEDKEKEKFEQLTIE